MRRLVLCSLLVGCNQYFDLEPTELSTEPPPKCPAFGTPLRFQSEVRQAIRSTCFGYTTSADTGMALASCLQPGKALLPAYGPADGPLETIELTTPTPSETLYLPPVLVPEGDEAFWFANNAGMSRVEIFALDGNTWRYSHFETGALNANASVPSRRPHRRIVYFDTGRLHESMQGDDGTWTEVGPPYDMFLVNTYRPYLSPDGLRLLTPVIVGSGNQSVVVYAERSRVEDRFGDPITLEVVPPTFDTFVTEDCGRVYFSGLSNVLYEQQLR